MKQPDSIAQRAPAAAMREAARLILMQKWAPEAQFFLTRASRGAASRAASRRASRRYLTASRVRFCSLARGCARAGGACTLREQRIADEEVELQILHRLADPLRVAFYRQLNLMESGGKTCDAREGLTTERSVGRG